MCLIVWKENEESVFTNRQFKNMITRNRDGLGIMYRDEGRVQVVKSVGSQRQKFKLWQDYRDLECYAMHARLTTHGKTNTDNCHPYEILNIDKGDPIDLFMMHNGVLSQAPEVDKTMSDTWHFIEYIIKPIAKTNLDLLWNSEEFQAWIQKTIAGNKLLFMRSDDVEHPVLILNYEAGKEETGCWLSNTYSTCNHSKTTTTCYSGSRTTSYGGTQSAKQNPTGQQSGGVTKTTTETSTNAKMDWDEYYKKQNKYQSETYSRDKTSKLFLPDATKDAKIVPLKDVVVSQPKLILTEDPEENLLYEVINLKGLTPHDVKQWVKEDPDKAADAILAFYEKNTMPYELIIQQIQDDKGIDGIVDILRHIVSGNVIAPKTIKNVS